MTAPLRELLWAATLLRILAYLVAALLAACALLFYRNERVYRFRSRLIDAVAAGCYRDVGRRVPGAWRWDALAAVPYTAMVLRFWRPLRPEAWWPDTRFLDPDARPSTENG